MSFEDDLSTLFDDKTTKSKKFFDAIMRIYYADAKTRCENCPESKIYKEEF